MESGLGRAMEPGIRWGSRSTTTKGNFWESRVAQRNVQRECGISRAKMAKPIKLSFTMVSEVGLVIIY